MIVTSSANYARQMLELQRDCCRVCSASAVASVKVVMIGERPDRIEIDAAEALRTYICRRRLHKGRYWFAFTGRGGRISVSSRSFAGELARARRPVPSPSAQPARPIPVIHFGW